MQSVLKNSIVIPVYRNEENIPSLLHALSEVFHQIGPSLEVVFVVDGSPDFSHALLAESLPSQDFPSTLVLLSRNFGSFAAIRHGLGLAQGNAIAVMAADLQEPPELAIQLLEQIGAGSDLAFGVRTGRADPTLGKLFSSVFWWAYRRWIMPEIPVGGVDIFAVSSSFRDRLLVMQEANTSLLAQLFWLGGNRAFVPYARRQRLIGNSAWTLSKKVRYLTDSIFSFTDLPVRLLVRSGAVGLLISLFMAFGVIAAKLMGQVDVPGYAATVLAVLFFGAFNALGLGIIGNYVWRAYENTKQRPLSISHEPKSYNYPSQGDSK